MLITSYVCYCLLIDHSIDSILNNLTSKISNMEYYTSITNFMTTDLTLNAIASNTDNLIAFLILSFKFINTSVESIDVDSIMNFIRSNFILNTIAINIDTLVSFLISSFKFINTSIESININSTISTLTEINLTNFDFNTKIFNFIYSLELS